MTSDIIEVQKRENTMLGLRYLEELPFRLTSFHYLPTASTTEVGEEEVDGGAWERMRKESWGREDTVNCERLKFLTVIHNQ